VVWIRGEKAQEKEYGRDDDENDEEKVVRGQHVKSTNPQ